MQGTAKRGLLPSLYTQDMETPMQPGRRDRLRNRDSILHAAQALFRERGIDVPLDTIAKRAGVGNATIYRHFPERMLLVAEVLALSLARSDEALQRGLAMQSAWDGFINYMEWLFQEQIDNAAYMTALRTISFGIDDEVDRLRDKTLHELEKLIDRAKEERFFRRDRWIEDVFLFLSLNEQLAHNGHADPRGASERFLELLLASVAVQARESDSALEPPTVISLRKTLGSELAGLPTQPRSIRDEEA
jgi:AcrR family transcriptional regulator